MPLPLIIAGMAVATATGLGAGVSGHQKKKKANDIIDDAKAQYELAKNDFDTSNAVVEKELQKLGTLELQIGLSFEKFDKLIKEIMIDNNFHTYTDLEIKIPKNQLNQIQEVAIRATDYLKVMAGGVISGIAASSFVTSMVVAFGAASTGTAISSLAGVAATNATLAAIGGGSLATGRLGIAGGTAILGGVAVVPLVTVAGLFYAHHSSKALKNAEEVEIQVRDAVLKIDKAKHQFSLIQNYVVKISVALNNMNLEFQKYFEILKKMNELIKVSDHEAIKTLCDEAYIYIQNGLAIAAAMAAIISTPLFKFKTNAAGKLILNQENQPIIQLDDNRFQEINVEGILTVVIEKNAVFNTIPKLA